MQASGLAENDEEERAARRKERVRVQAKAERQKKNSARPDREMRTVYTWGDGGRGQMGHGELYTVAFFTTQNPADNAALQVDCCRVCG